MVHRGRARGWGVAGATFLVWALAAGSLVYWLLRGGVPVTSQAGPVAAPALAAVDTQEVARALGAAGAAPAVSTAAGSLQGVKLLGVLTHGGGGVALVAVGSAPPTAVRVGAALEGLDAPWRLRAVHPHGAVLAWDGHEETLELPPPDARSRAGDAVPQHAPATGRGPMVQLPAGDATRPRSAAAASDGS